MRAIEAQRSRGVRVRASFRRQSRGLAARGTAPAAPRRPRGSSLIEVLIAMTILAILMVGILQMFTLSLLVNSGSAARTTMLLKAQQVVENIRLASFMARQGNTTMATRLLDPAAFTGIGSSFVLVQGDYQIPYNTSSTQFVWWGPTEANVMETEDGEYTIAYRIDVVNPAPGFPAASGRIGYVIRVTCVPAAPGGTGPRFFGAVANKRIDYAAQIIL